MPFVQRGIDGKITALYRCQSNEAQEFLPPTHAEVLDFLDEEKHTESSKQALAESDSDIARVTEDLIHLLVAKNLILFTDLPDAVQRKLSAREKMRSSLQESIEDFLDDNDTL